MHLLRYLLPLFLTCTCLIEGIYTFPGVVALQDGDWVGSEHLYNLSPQIGVVVEIVYSSGNSTSLTEEGILNKITPILKAGGLTVREPLISGTSPLPFLNILIIIHPIEKGYVAYCTGQLFEEVTLRRIQLKPGTTWQAVTWEQQELVVFAKEHLQEQVEKTVQNIVTAFAARYKSYEHKK